MYYSANEVDLNELLPSGEDETVTEGCLTVHFRDLQQHLIQYIRQADLVLGSVAWLTEGDILDALAEVQSSIVVQKEDFLRPDMCRGKKKFSRYLSEKYARLTCNWTRYGLPGIAPQLSYCGDQRVAPVRCVGNHNSTQSPAFPRAHNKFAVFCREVSQTHECGYGVPKPFAVAEPYAVWTGSFNWSKTATRSLDNALYTTSPKIVEAYAAEWSQIFALSEPLDWSSEWVEPEYRIGS